MPKHRYQVEHDGLTFKRSTDRTYTHVVLRPISLARSLDEAARNATWDWENNQDFHQERITGQRRNYRGELVPVEPEEVAASQAWLARGLAGHIADNQEARRASWQASHGEKLASWSCFGWCGRLDLAQKQAKPGDVIVEVAHG